MAAFEGHEEPSDGEEEDEDDDDDENESLNTSHSSHHIPTEHASLNTNNNNNNNTDHFHSQQQMSHEYDLNLFVLSYERKKQTLFQFTSPKPFISTAIIFHSSGINTSAIDSPVGINRCSSSKFIFI